MAMNGLEITPEREKRVLMSRPYCVYTLQVVVRKEETRIRSIADLKGMTTLISTHEMGFASEVADRVVMFDQGDIIESALPAQLFSAPSQERTRTFLRRLLDKN